MSENYLGAVGVAARTIRLRRAGLTYSEIGRDVGLSGARIRQICVKHLSVGPTNRHTMWGGPDWVPRWARPDKLHYLGNVAHVPVRVESGVRQSTNWHARCGGITEDEWLSIPNVGRKVVRWLESVNLVAPS